MKERAVKGLKIKEPLIFERSAPDRAGVKPSCGGVPAVKASELIPEKFLRPEGDAMEGFPEVSEGDVIRHYTRLSQWNFGVDTGFYPLGSCTMKYNPRINETIARMPGFSRLHPLQDAEYTQGALRLMYELSEDLSRITGMDAMTLQPSAGAQGEFCGLLAIAAYLKDKGLNKNRVIIPDTAHGTNPASAHLAGFKVTPVKVGPEGILTLAAVEKVLDDDVAAIMLTNPNTLGLFESHIKEIADALHSRGGLLYCDGANLNALMGIARLGDMGVDVVHINLHKTFSSPHGGGGPGSGPVGVVKGLEPYLPVPRVMKKGETFSLDYKKPLSIGRLNAFYGNFAVLVRAYAYIRRLGPDGLRRVSETAVLNANYIRAGLEKDFELPYDHVPPMHECVFSDKLQGKHGITTLDMAKRLMDYGYHPPTIYFPTVVHGAMMIEPTETESLETLDNFIETMKAIAHEAVASPELIKGAPHNTIVGRVDEAMAARNPYLRWRTEEK
ncbi:MAG: aminomethyl-transferring glycine dehydrogenase subunit GcvPB [Thermodesulfobacteriota bacterium]